jgi:tRNA-dihydrouridine synthase B
MFKIGNIEIKDALLLAPMEDVTDISFRVICRQLGADVVYTEFVNSEGLIRKSAKTHKKLEIVEEERPVGIQIYGGSIASMVSAAKIAEEKNPDIIDINAGCWVKGVVACGAGAGLLKDPEHLQQLVKEVVNSVSIPVTVKTRIGWDADNIHILDIAKRLEDVGVKALTIHCRTRSQAHNGEADWSWIPKIKEVVKIPVALNGGIYSAQDVKKAFDETGADAVMIARGAIGNPWIFAEAKAIQVKGERRAVLENRKYYTGYLKSLYNASKVRAQLMTVTEFDPVVEILNKYEIDLDILYSNSPELVSVV